STLTRALLQGLLQHKSRIGLLGRGHLINQETLTVFKWPQAALTTSTDFMKAALSSLFNFSSITRSTPRAPRTAGTSTYTSFRPYSPFKCAVRQRTIFLSLITLSTILVIPCAGAKIVAPLSAITSAAIFLVRSIASFTWA